MRRAGSSRWYEAYLCSQEWHITRFKRLRKDGFMCYDCYSEYKLQVHHKTYKRVGKERMADLVTLCRRCHMKRHAKART